MMLALGTTKISIFILFFFLDIWHKKVLEMSPHIKKVYSLRIDKNLMPQKIHNEYLGVEGNFRKLDID